MNQKERAEQQRPAAQSTLGTSRATSWATGTPLLEGAFLPKTENPALYTVVSTCPAGYCGAPRTDPGTWGESYKHQLPLFVVTTTSIHWLNDFIINKNVPISNLGLGRNKESFDFAADLMNE